jgi:hypothetical protein
MYFVGPGFAAGVVKPLGKMGRWQVVPEIQYFRKQFVEDITPIETYLDRFTAYSFRVNMNHSFRRGRSTNTGWLLGLGVGVQHVNSVCETNIQTGSGWVTTKHADDNYSYTAPMGSFNMGYSFAIGGKNKLQLLLNGIGPYMQSEGTYRYVELLSTLGLHARFVF